VRIPQKWQYAIRGVFELARRHGQGPIKVSEIADIQDLPARFLEVILNQLKRFDIVDSRRGNEGGYLLARSPHNITVGEIIRCLDGDDGPIRTNKDNNSTPNPLYGDCVFLPLWEKAWNAMWEVYDNTTFQKLVDDAIHMNEKYVPIYAI